jgi:hypothetical protein
VTDYLPQILTVVGTLGGSLGGVALTQRHQRRVVWMERAEKRRAELRSRIVEFLISADDWESQMRITIAVIWVGRGPLIHRRSTARLDETQPLRQPTVRPAAALGQGRAVTKASASIVTRTRRWASSGRMGSL